MENELDKIIAKIMEQFDDIDTKIAAINKELKGQQEASE
jgi:hypothetical protein